MCFDIAIQCGAVSDDEAEDYRARLRAADQPSAQKRRVLLAYVVAEHTRNTRYIEDVRTRKRTLATGRGRVHQADYHVSLWGLADQASILDPQSPSVLASPEAGFAEFVRSLNLAHFTPDELSVLGAAHSRSGHPGYGLNTLPPEELWPNIALAIRLLERLRSELGKPIRILSACRSPRYNTAVGGAARTEPRRRYRQLEKGRGTLMIDPILVVSAVRAAVRFYHAGDRVLAQKLRDRAMQIPGARFTVTVPEPLSAARLQDLVEGQRQGFKDWLQSERARQDSYQAMLDGNPEGLRRMRSLWERFDQEQTAKEDAEGEGSLETLLAEIREREIDNWLNDPSEPVSPWLGFAISLADIAAEFVAAKPQIVIEGEEASALIGSFAGSISELIPDDGKYGLQQAVGSRLMGVVLRAGLQTLSSNRKILFEKEQVQALVDGSLKPVIAAFPDDSAEQLNWERVSNAVMGPALSAAFGVVAESPSAFFGKRFDTEKILGAMTRDLLNYASETGLEGVLKRDGLIGLYTTALGVVATRPELVLEGKGPRTEFFKDLLSKVAATMKDHPLQLDAGVAVLLAQATVKTFGVHSGAILRLHDSEPWEAVATKALKQILDGLGDGVADRTNLERVFTQDQLVELVQLIAEQAARMPEMIVGNSEELRGVVAAVASAIEADENLLLEGQDWLKIVAVALDEAGRNPGRLFRFEVDDPKSEVGAGVISALLAEAARTARTGRQGGAVLFGDTLLAAIVSALRLASSNPKRTADALTRPADGVETLMSNLLQQVSEVVAKKDDQGRFAMGSKEWLRLFRMLLPEVLARGTAVVLIKNGEMTEECLRRIEEILAGGALTRIG